MSLPRSLVILGCSQRKKQTSRLIPAIDRYDGPMFQVLRKHARDNPEASPDTFVLSGRFGLIAGQFPIPRYNRRLKQIDHSVFGEQLQTQLKRTIDECQPDRLFVSVGSSYWSLLKEPLLGDAVADELTVATGGIGGRASQLAHWLRWGLCQDNESSLEPALGQAVLLGTSVRLSSAEVLRLAEQAFIADPQGARRFETWYVEVAGHRVAPKWLVSVLFDKSVSRFRTADAMRVLHQLGVETIYAYK
jgi:hypothetical protein